MSTDLGASYNLTDEGIRLLSASAREFKLTSAGLKTTTRGDDASTPPRTSPTDAPPRTSTSLTSSVLAREAWSRRRSTSPPTASSPSR